MSNKNRVLVSILILMGAAMLGSCMKSGDANAASATAFLIQDCADAIVL